MESITWVEFRHGWSAYHGLVLIPPMGCDFQCLVVIHMELCAQLGHDFMTYMVA